MNYFTEKELSCPCCGVSGIKERSLNRLNTLRANIYRPIILSSSYRCEKYNNEKGYTQTHATGQAFDVKCSHKDAFYILERALNLGFTGIGISQKGGGRFIHFDDLQEAEGRPRPHVWSY